MLSTIEKVTLGKRWGMTKSELIRQLSEQNPSLKFNEVERVVNTIFEEITNALANGSRIELRGFGAFSVKARSARTGRNPRTGVSVDVPEKFIPYFRTSRMLRARLNDKASNE